MTTQNWRSWIFWENPRLPKSRPKGPKWLNLFICLLLQHFLQDWVIIFFLYFAWSWGTISTQNWWSRIFWKKSCLPKSRLKGPKWPNLSICPLLQHFSQDWVISSVIFCVKLRDHKYSKLTGLNFLGKFSLAQKWAKKVQNGLLCVFLRYDSTFFTIDSLFFFFFLVFYTRFYLMTLDSYIRNHILAENMYFTRNIEWTERKIINNYK